MRRLLLISLLAVIGAALIAPVPAQAQSQQDLECVIDALGLPDSGGSLLAGLEGLSPEEQVEELLDIEAEIEKAEDCLGRFLPGFDRDFCDDCDPTFDFEEIRQVIIRFDRGRALRQRLLECRDRRLNKTQSEDSARDCRGLEAIFELYVNDEASLEARRRSDARPVGTRSAGRGARSVPAGATATLKLRPTRRGTALIARRGRVRAKVVARVPGAFTVRTVTLTR